MPRVIHDETVITKALHELETSWVITSAQWNDKARTDFDKNFIEPLLPQVKRAADAMAQISRLLRKAVNKCS